MKQVQVDTGGRPFNYDDLLTLQQELTDATQAQFLGKGPFILAGCQVSGTGAAVNISAGIVCLDGQLLRFAGAGAVTLPAQLQTGATVFSYPRPYQTGGTKNCMREVPAVLVAADPTYTAGEFLPLDAWGGKRWEDVVRASVRSANEVQQVASVVTNNYDATTGLGKPGTEAWGWGLCDGQGGRADLRGRFIVGLDPARADYDAVGDTGGEETHMLIISEMPSHSHSHNANRTTSTIQYGSGGTGGSPQPGSATIDATGGGQAHENRPPFYVLAMRQWVGY